MGLDDARRRLADEEAKRTRNLTPQDYTQMLFTDVEPLLQRLLVASRKHVSVRVLRQRFQAERAEQFAARPPEEQKSSPKDLTTAHALVGDCERLICRYKRLEEWNDTASTTNHITIANNTEMSPTASHIVRGDKNLFRSEFSGSVEVKGSNSFIC